MEKLDIPSTAIVQYLLIYYFPWFIGVVVGGGLGVLCAHGFRAFLSTRPALRCPLVLVPWRTLVMGLLVAVWSPLIVSVLGLGPAAGGVMVGSSVSVLAAAFTATTLVEDWYPSPIRARLIGGARTLAVASCLIAVVVGQIGGGGLGDLMRLAIMLSDHSLMWQGVLIVLALALVLDLALGLGQLIVLRRSGDSGGPATAEGTAA